VTTEDLLDAGQSLQVDALRLWSRCGYAVGGWKVGLTSGTSRDVMGAGYRPFGFILGERIHPAHSAIELATLCGPVLEPELGLKLRSDLSGPVDRQEACAAIGAVVPCFEVVESRRNAAHTPGPLIVADALLNWGAVVGAGSALRDSDLRTCAVTLTSGNHVEEIEPPGQTMDDPIDSLVRLSAKLSKYGLRLSAGQVVITGAFTHAAIAGPGSWTASFADIGTVSVTFV
jgi:2-keto-4-pentenoate hydratase